MTEADERALTQWLAADRRHADAFAKVETFWAAMGSGQVRSTLRDHHSFAAMYAAPPHRARRRTALALAASLVLLVVNAQNDWITWVRADAMTATGERRSLSLPDGTSVELNTASAIAVDYGRSARTIRLIKGEAAFHVAPDHHRPFTVVAGSGSTTALGTRFIVRQDGDQTSVTVTEHRVRVARNTSPTIGSIVIEGQMVRYGPDGIEHVRQVDSGAAEAWVRGTLVFVDRPLGEVVRELNRYHAGHIALLGTDLAKRRVSGGVSIKDPVKAIDALEDTLGFRSIRITDRLILLFG